MARTPTPDVKITEALQPAQQQIDTYVRPATPAPSPLWEVAKALGPLSDELLSLGAKQEGEWKKNEQAAGEAQFWRNNAEGASDAVANGAVPAQASKPFMEGYGRMAGLNDAQRIGQTIGPDYNALDKNLEDPAAFDKWFFPYMRSKFNPAMEGNTAYMKSWATGVQALHAQYSAQYVKDRSEAVREGAFQKFSGVVGNTIDDTYLSAGGSPDAAALADTLQSIREAGTKSGLEKAKVDKAIVDIVATKATKYKDPSLLSLIDQMPAATQTPGAENIMLGATEHGSHTKLTVAKTIETLQHQDRERQRTEQLHKDKTAHDSALKDVIEGWSKDPNSSPTDAQRLAIEKVDPTFQTKVATYRENLLKRDVVEDPQKLSKLYEDIGKGNGGMPAVMQAIGNGTLKTKDSIKAAADWANLVENYNRQGGSFKITEDPAFKSMEQAIISHTKDPKFFGSMFAEQGLTDAGRRALNDARMAAMKWAMSPEGQAADPLTRQAKIFELQEAILKGITAPAATQGGEAMSEFKVQYVSPFTGAGVPPVGNGPFSPPPTLPAQPQQPTPQPGVAQPQRQGALGTPEQVITALQSLPAAPKAADLQQMGVSPEMVKRLNDLAAQNGKTPDQALEQMWNAAKSKAPGKRSDVQPSDNPEQQVNPQLAEAQGSEKPFTVSLPGGGRMDLHGVSLENAAALNEMAQRMARLGMGVQPQQQQASAGNTQQDKQTGDGSMRGELSARYESARAGSGSIAHDDTGGWSYGRYQFASGGSVADGSAVKAFIGQLKKTAPELAQKLEAAGGQPAARSGSAAFKQAWAEASKDPRFRQAEDEAAWSYLVGPAVAQTKKSAGLDVTQRSKAVQEVMWSTAIQHGGKGAANLWAKAIRNTGRSPDDLSDAQLINALYAERSKVDVYFKSSKPGIKASVANRFANERRDALAMLAKEGQPTKVASAE